MNQAGAGELSAQRIGDRAALPVICLGIRRISCQHIADQITQTKIDIDAGALRKIAVVVHFLRRHHQIIAGAQIIERIVDKKAAGTLLDVEEFIVVVKVVLQHPVVRTAHGRVDIDPVQVKIGCTHIFSSDYGFIFLPKDRFQAFSKTFYCKIDKSFS